MNCMVTLSATLRVFDKPPQHWKRFFHSLGVVPIASGQSEGHRLAMHSQVGLASKPCGSSCAIARWKLVDPSLKPWGGGSTFGSLAALCGPFAHSQGFDFGIARARDSTCAQVSTLSASISRAAVALERDSGRRTAQLLDSGVNTELADVSGDAVVLGTRKQRGLDAVRRQSSEAVRRQTPELEDQKMGRGKQLGAPGLTAYRGVREAPHEARRANNLSRRIQGVDQLQGRGGVDGGASLSSRQNGVSDTQASGGQNARSASPPSAELSRGEFEQLTNDADRRARSLDTGSTSGRGAASPSSGGGVSPPQKERSAQGRFWHEPSLLMQADVSNGASDVGRGARTVISRSGAADVSNGAAHGSIRAAYVSNGAADMSNGAAHGSNGAAYVSNGAADDRGGPSGLNGLARSGAVVATQASSRGLALAARPKDLEPAFAYVGNGAPNAAITVHNGAAFSELLPSAGSAQPSQSWKAAADHTAPVEMKHQGAGLDRQTPSEGRISSFGLNGAEAGKLQTSSRVLAVRGRGGDIEQHVEDSPASVGVIRDKPVASVGKEYPKSLFQRSALGTALRGGGEKKGGVVRGKAEENASQANGMNGGGQLKMSSRGEKPMGAASSGANSRSIPAGTQPANLSVYPPPNGTQLDFAVPQFATPGSTPFQSATLVKPDSPSIEPVTMARPQTSTSSVSTLQTEAPNPQVMDAPAKDAAAPKTRKIPEMKMRKAKPKTLNPRKSAKQTQASSMESAPTKPANGGVPQACSAPPSTEKITLEAVVRRIVYENQDNGYVIARVKPVGDVSNLGAHVPGTQKRGWGGKTKAGKEGEDLLTVVGTLPKIAEGQPLRLTGNWRDNAKFGREFVAAGCEEMEVSSLPDLVTYLGGGSLPKVGPVRAAAIVGIYGDQSLKMLDSSDAVKKLQQVPGIGRSTASEIKAAWEERRGVRKTMDFLQLHGVPASAAQRIVRRHGDKTETLVRDDPWEATAGVHGFGFDKADALARSMGTCPSLTGRLTSAIRSVLTSVCGSDGHTYLPWREVRAQTAELLAQTGGLSEEEREKGWGVEPDREAFEQGLRVLVRRAKLVVEGNGGTNDEERLAGWIGDAARCYLPVLHTAEVSLAENVKTRLTHRPNPSDSAGQWSVESQNGAPDELSAQQREAVEMAMTAPMLILTGGPGTGKTYTLRTIVALWKSMGKTVQCCAPTGRAAQRLAESVGMDAKTIHRLLEYKPGEAFWGKNGDAAEEADVTDLPRNFFARDARNPLECDALVVDEASMLDLPLADALFYAVPPNTPILLVGDIDQLPPVGPGHVLRDLINSNRVPVFRLTEVFRQAQQSAIVTNAHAINQGRFPNLELTQAKPAPRPPQARPKSASAGSTSPSAASGGQLPGGFSGAESARGIQPGSHAALLESSERDGVIALRSAIVESDCLWVNVPEYKVAAALQEVISPGGLLSQLQIDPRKDVQVLSPIKKGGAGTSALNTAIQGLINAPSAVKGEVEYRQVVFRKGDRVIQTSNDYERAVFNGDLGTVCHVDPREKRVTVRFHNRAAGSEAEVVYSPQMSGVLACLEDLSLAWAVTVHKSQGSEYPVVLLPVSKWHQKLLSRKLIYTGLTRARKLVVVIGPRGPIETAVATITDDDRYTYLKQRLESL